VRALGGILFLVGVGASYGNAPYEEMVSLIIFICLGIPIGLSGAWILGYTFKLTFDHSLGNMTIKKGVGPLTYRTRHISKREVVSVRAFELPRERYYGTWAVSLGIMGRKKEVKIIGAVAKNKATYLAKMIKAFARA